MRAAFERCVNGYARHDAGWRQLVDGLNLSTANWTANKPDLDQSQFDVLNIAGLKFFVDEIRIATTVDDAVPTGGSDPQFLRGDCNGDDAVDISDPVFTLSSLFLGDGDPRSQASHVDDEARNAQTIWA